MDEIASNNRVILCGIAAGEPLFSHENRTERFFAFPLEVERLSGNVDRINIILRESMLPALRRGIAAPAEIEGELRSFNNRSGQGNRLVITVLARSVSPGFGAPCNLVRLRGRLCKPPVRRRTPLGRDICDLLLAVDRRYRRSDYLPCIAWGALSHHCGGLGPGDPLWLEGRLQSRGYRKTVGETVQERTAFEVSISSLEEPSEEAPRGTGES